MGQEIVYCNECGIQITAKEFEKHRAVTVLGKNYCRKCMKSVVEQGKLPDQAKQKAPESPVPRVKQFLGGGRKTPSRHSRTPATSKVPLAEKERTAPLDPTTRMLLIIGGIIIVILILIGIVLNQRRTS